VDKSLSKRSQRALELAVDEASRLHHEYIGTEHILLGIASEGNGVAFNVLKSFGITLDEVRSGVETIVGVGPCTASPHNIGVTPRAKQVINFAQEEATKCSASGIEPEHLLLGVTREVHGVAAQVLRHLQAPPESVQNKVWALLGNGDGDSSQTA
jgi:ATP-dependent Clp protease ATP-binding subunit ClpC